MEETPAQLHLLLRFLDIGTGKTCISDFRLTVAEVWDLFQLLERYAVIENYRTLFKTILGEPDSVLDVDGRKCNEDSVLNLTYFAVDMPLEEKAALMFKLRMVAYELKLECLWNGLRLWLPSLLKVPKDVEQKLLPEYLDVVVGVLTVSKVASRLSVQYKNHILSVGYTSDKKLYFYVGNDTVVHYL